MVKAVSDRSIPSAQNPAAARLDHNLSFPALPSAECAPCRLQADSIHSRRAVHRLLRSLAPRLQFLAHKRSQRGIFRAPKQRVDHIASTDAV